MGRGRFASTGFYLSMPCSQFRDLIPRLPALPSQVRDRDLSLTKGLGVRGTPTIIVLGKDRQVLYDAHRAPEDWAELEGASRE